MSHKHQLHQLNPNWEKAEKHGQASKTGFVNYQLTAEMDEQVMCHCCNEHFAKQPINLMVHSKQLQFLGLGFPLFYEFLKLCMLMLTVSIGCYHALALFTDRKINFRLCHPHQTQSAETQSIYQENFTSSSEHSSVVVCYTFFVQIASIAGAQLSNQSAMRVISFLVQLLTLLFIRNQLIKMEAYYDQRSTTLADYSMMITGIRRQGGVRKSICDFFNKQMGTNPPEIAEIMLIPEVTDLEKLKQERKQIIQQLKKFYKGNQEQPEHGKTLDLTKDLAKINEKILTFARRSYRQIKSDKIACDKAIVIFNSEQDRINAQQAFEKKDPDSLAEYFGIQHTVQFQQAPEPEEIIWENSSVPQKEKTIRIIIGWTLSLIVLAAVFAVFYIILVEKSLLLQKASKQLVEHPEEPTSYTQYRGAIFLVYLLMFLVVLFDKIVLSHLFHKFTQLQKHSTTADLQFSFALKYALGLFFTTALMTLTVQAIKFHNYYSHLYGVIDEQSIMFLMNSFFIPFFWLVNPMRIWKNLKRKLYFGEKNLTQEEANKLMQQETYDLGKRFAEVIEMMWFVYLYSTLIPIGAVIIVIGLFFYYWVDKYNLLRRSKVHGKVSGHFIQTSLTLLDVTLLLRPLGSLIFDSQIRDGSYLPANFVMICIALAYLVFPKNYFIHLLNEEQFKPEQKEYSQVKHRFHHNYQSEHPLYNLLTKEELEETSKENREFEDHQLINIPNCFDIIESPFQKDQETSKQKELDKTRKSVKSQASKKSNKSHQQKKTEKREERCQNLFPLKTNRTHVKLKPIEHFSSNGSKESSQVFIKLKHIEV